MTRKFFTEKSMRSISILNIFLQSSATFLPLVPVFTVSAADVKASQPYKLLKGETPESIAKKFDITVEQLKKLNQFRVFPGGFDNIQPGQEIDVPATPDPRQVANTQPASQEEQTVASWMMGAGNFFQSNPDSDAALSLAKGIATSRAGQELEAWLGKKGTAKVNLNVDEDLSLKGSSLDVLYPFWEDKQNIAFTQVGIRDSDDRTQSNLGFGLRHFAEDYMLGGNLFYDHDLSRNHNRLGVGVEYWRNYLKLSSNAYMRLSGWKDSKDLEDYEERAANGWDVRAEGYLPAYPQLGGKITYEQYYGDKVGLFGNSEDDLQKDPYALTAGVSYTPVPLVSVTTDYKTGKDGKNETSIGLNLTYSVGVPFKDQLNSDAVAMQRSLIGSRYDLVDRNNNIVLEYRNKEVIRLNTLSLVTGKSGETKSLGVSVNAKHGLEKIVWTADELLAHGGQIIAEDKVNYSVVLPAFRGDGKNTYSISGVAIDKKGNSSSPSETQLTVLAALVSKTKSQFGPAEAFLPADGSSSQTFTLQLRDEENKPVKVSADQIQLNVEHASDSVKNKKRLKKKKARPEATTSTFSKFTEVSSGNYEMTLTAGEAVEVLTLTPVVEGIVLSSAKAAIGGMPVIRELTVGGAAEVGGTLTATYKFDANKGEPTDKSLFLWGEPGSTEAAVAEKGKAVEASGKADGLVIIQEDLGKIKEISVLARNGIEIDGNTLTADSTALGQVVDPAAKPLIENLAIAGTLEAGKTLTGKYSFNAQGGSEDQSLAFWGHQGQTAAKVSAEGTAVKTSEKTPDYPITAADVGAVIELSVLAKNSAGIAGNTLTTDSTMTAAEGNGTEGGDGNGLVVDPSATPEVSDVKITGKLEVGSALSGQYAFDPRGGDKTDKSLYQWGNKGSTAGEVASKGKEVTASGEAGERTLKAADIGNVLELSVMARNGASTVGNTATVDTSMDEGNETEGGGEGGIIINPSAAPEVSNLVMEGEYLVGKTLSGHYDFDPKNGDSKDNSLFAWGYQGETAAEVSAKGTPVTTSGTTGSRELLAADAGKVMELSVLAKNGLNVTGNTETKDSTMDGGDGQVVNPGAVPAVSDLTVKGTLDVGQALEGTYSFNSNGGETSDKSLFKWGNKGQTAGSVVGEGKAVSVSGSVDPLTLAATDIGQVMELSVLAQNGAGVSGNTQTVDTSMPGAGNETDGGDGEGHVIDPEGKPSIKSLAIKGVLEVGEALSGNYTFNAEGGNDKDKSMFIWGYKGETANDVAGSGSVVTTSGAVVPHTLVDADAGQVMELSVQARNGLDVAGNTLTVDSSMRPAGGNETEGGTEEGQVLAPASAPVASDVKMTGTLEPGKTVKGSYSFDANNGEPTDKSLFMWGYQGETAGGVAASGTEITTSGQTAARVIKPADAGHIMELTVLAKNGAGIEGNAKTVDSSMEGGDGNETEGGNGGSVIDPKAQPEVSDIAISGVLEAGQTLGGKYSFNANKGHPEDKSQYVWGHQGETAGGIAGGSAVASSGEVEDYKLVPADVGTVMELSIQARNALDVAGNTLTVDTSMAAGEGNETEGGDGNGHITNPDAVPVIENITVKGLLEVGEALTGTYVFDAANGDATDKSLFLWGKKGETASAVASSSSVVTDSGKTEPYTLTAADVGQFVELSVLAKNGRGVAGNTLTVDSTMSAGEGNELEGGDGGMVIDANSAPEIKGLKITGSSLEMGAQLEAVYTFDAHSGQPDDKSLYVWGYQGETAEQLADGAVVAEEGKVPAHTLSIDDVGHVIEVSVLAKNGNAIVGNTMTQDSRDKILRRANLTATMDNETVKKGEDITLTVEARNADDGQLAVNSPVTIIIASTTGRDGASKPATATINGTDYFSGETDSMGKLTVTLNDDNGIGTMTTLDITPGLGDSVQKSGTFTVVTSPNSENAKMWGHMEETVNAGGITLHRPYLADEAPSGGNRVENNETWARMNISSAMAFCRLPSDSDLKAVYGALGNMANQGWPVYYQFRSEKLKNNSLAYRTIRLDTGKDGATSDASANNEAVYFACLDGQAPVDSTALPDINNLTLEGELKVGGLLRASYEFNPNSGDENDTSLYAWGYQGTSAGQVSKGERTRRSGVMASRQLTVEDAGQVVELSILPRNGLSKTGIVQTIDSAMDTSQGNMTTGGDVDGKVALPGSGPYISELKLSGKLDVGQELTGAYTFEANGGDTTDKSLALWGEQNLTAVGVKRKGTEVETAGITTKVLVTEDTGTVVELSVLAQNGAMEQGNILTVDSSMSAGKGNNTSGGINGMVTNTSSPPTVSKLTIIGDPEVGQTLTGNYIFSSNGGNRTDKSLYLWGAPDTTAELVEEQGQVVATAQRVPGKTLTIDDLGNVIEVSLLAVNGNGLKGNTITEKTKAITRAETLEVDLGKKQAKKGETIVLTVKSTNSDDGSANPDAPVTISATAKNRKGINQTVTASFNDSVGSFTGTTDSNGMLTINIKDEGPGLETSFVISGTGSSTVEKSVIFTVASSPDSAKANYWGHMTDTLTAGGVTFNRPYLADEVSTETANETVDGEVWARFNGSAAAAVCTQLPTLIQLQSLATAEGATLKEQHGWDTTYPYRTNSGQSLSLEDGALSNSEFTSDYLTCLSN